MAYSTRYIEACHCMLLDFSGSITAKDILDAVRELPQYIKTGTPLSGIISDYSDVTEFNVFANGIREVADSTLRVSIDLPDISVAVVAPTPTIFGSSRMWEVYCNKSSWTNNTFKTREAAESWMRENLDIEHCKRQDCLIKKGSVT